jgi:hypothetical protein
MTMRCGCGDAGWQKATASAQNGGCVEVAWRKATASNSNGCVEVGWQKATASSDANGCVEVGWRKATASYANGNCVEAGDGECGMVHIRDSKNPDGAVLTVSPAQWRAFLDAVRLFWRAFAVTLPLSTPAPGSQRPRVYVPGLTAAPATPTPAQRRQADKNRRLARRWQEKAGQVGREDDCTRL